MTGGKGLLMKGGKSGTFKQKPSHVILMILQHSCQEKSDFWKELKVTK